MFLRTKKNDVKKKIPVSRKVLADFFLSSFQGKITLISFYILLNHQILTHLTQTNILISAYLIIRFNFLYFNAKTDINLSTIIIALTSQLIYLQKLTRNHWSVVIIIATAISIVSAPCNIRVVILTSYIM